MNIIPPSYEIETFDGIEMMKRVEKAGKICYKSEGTIKENSYDSFIRARIKQGHESVLEHEKITVRIICDRGVCYSQDTKILTDEGWKYFYELTKLNKIYTKDDTNNLLLMKPIKIIKKKYNGKMMHIHTTQLDYLITPNHNMWVFDYNKRSSNTKKWKFIKAKDLKNNRYLFSRGANYSAESPLNISICPVIIPRGFAGIKTYEGFTVDAKLFMKFLGIWVTDGSLRKKTGKSGRGVVITQKKQKGRKEIERLLKVLGIKYKINGLDYRISNPPLYEFLKKNFIQNDDYKKSYYIKIPIWIKQLGPDLINYFLDGVILGDGTPHAGNAGGYQIYTASLPFAEDLVEISLKCGKVANIYFPKMRYVPGRKIQQKKPQYVVSIVKTITTLFNKSKKTFEELMYTGNVYCVELPKYHRLYVMRNGKPGWCGNSHEIVRHRIASYSQESTRYCNYAESKFGNEITVIDITKHFEESIKDKENLEKVIKQWERMMRASEQTYLLMTKKVEDGGLGVPPQLARSVLPNSLKTEIVITMNLREWRHFFRLRTDKAAHPQMREITIPLFKELKEKLPPVFDDIG